MRYPRTERELFAEQVKRFHEGYRTYMEKAIEVFEEKARLRDTSTPIWHNYRFPESFLDQVRQKSARCDNAWEAARVGHLTEEEALHEIASELSDIINYAAYLAALIEIFRVEETTTKGDVRVLSPRSPEQPATAGPLQQAPVPPRTGAPSHKV